MGWDSTPVHIWGHIVVMVESYLPVVVHVKGEEASGKGHLGEEELLEYDDEEDLLYKEEGEEAGGVNQDGNKHLDE